MTMSRFFDDMEVGAQLPVLVKGPLSTMHLMRWSAAMENWHRIHYDQPFATGHEKLPGLLINGSLKQQFILQQLKDWAGRGGWVWKVDFQFRGMSVVGDTLSCWAEVVGTRRTQGFGLVDLKLGVRNRDGQETTPGTAVVALPYRDGPAVPYPFVPPPEEVAVP